MPIGRDELIAFEADVAASFNAGKIRAPVHLSGGNEDELIEIFKQVGPDDWILTTWRSHYHALLRGVPAHRIMADILAGHSITLCYPEYRLLSSAIVGGILPIATGIAWAIKRRGGKERVWAFMGDMAASTGVAAETRQYAWGHRLPITWVVEDNGLSVVTPTGKTWSDTPDDGIPSHMREEWPTRTRSHAYKLKWPHSGAGKRVNF